MFFIALPFHRGYQLFVNGARVRYGPARGEMPHWRFETTDLVPHLKAGDNIHRCRCVERRRAPARRAA